MQKRQRTGAVQELARCGKVVEVTDRFWSAAALRRFPACDACTTPTRKGEVLAPLDKMGTPSQSFKPSRTSRMNLDRSYVNELQLICKSTLVILPPTTSSIRAFWRVTRRPREAACTALRTGQSGQGGPRPPPSAPPPACTQCTPPPPRRFTTVCLPGPNNRAAAA